MTVALERHPWTRRSVSVAVLVALSCSVSAAGLLPALSLAAGCAVLVSAASGGGWTALAAGLLPPSERECWRAEVRAVLHAAPDGKERRRQVRGYLLGLPACVTTAWLVALRWS